MMQRQHDLPLDVFQGDRQDDEAKVGNGLVDPRTKWLGDLQFAEGHFDPDFPQRARANREYVTRGLNRHDGRRTQLTGIILTPDQCVRVEQVGHSIYSLKSSNGSSKSGAIYNTEPCCVPSF